MTNDHPQPSATSLPPPGRVGEADPRRALPSVARLIDAAENAGLVQTYGLELLTVQAQRLLEGLRSKPELVPPDVSLDVLTTELIAALEIARGEPIQRVINATGVFLHTNLGRAPLPALVLQNLAPLLDAGCDLEMDLATGKRGDRNDRVNALLCSLTTAEGALVVNNNAAALVLALATLAQGKQVIVSRGELVEIGGSFRIPDILQSAGAELVEVGTTNRTRIADYEQAIGEETAMLLKVYPSNYRIRGFTESVPIGELAELARSNSIPLLMDEGSGVLRAREEAVFDDHQSVASLLADGCDLVCGSGDKVLGGTQAGLLFGRADLIAQCRNHPLYRALRPSRLVLVALRAILDLQLRSQPLPIDRLFVAVGEHRKRLESVAGLWPAHRDFVASRTKGDLPRLRIVPGAAYVGGGSAPDRRIEGEVLALAVGQSVADALRRGSPSVMGRMRANHLLLDLRTVDQSDDEALLGSLARALCATES